MDTIATRLKIALEMREMSQADLVKRTGIGKSSISTYLSGEYEPKQKNTYKLAKALNVNEAWLMGLDVDIERKDNVVNLSDKELKLLKMFDCLNDIGKKEAQKRVEELTLIDKYSKSNSMLKAAARNGDITELPDSPLIDKDIENADDPDFL